MTDGGMPQPSTHPSTPPHPTPTQPTQSPEQQQGGAKEDLLELSKSLTADAKQPTPAEVAEEEADEAARLLLAKPTHAAAADETPQKKKKLSASDKHALGRLWKETIPYEKGYMCVGVVAMLVSSATNMAFPALIGRVLDRTTKAASEVAGEEKMNSTEIASLQVFVGQALLIFVAGAVGSCVRTHCLRMAKEGTARRLRKKLLHSLLRQEKAFFDDPEQGGHRTGEMVAILEGDVEASSEVFTTKLADGLRSCSSALNGTGMLLRLSPKLTAVSLGLVPVFTAAIVANVLLTRKLTARQRELAAAATGFAQERLGNLLTVHAFTAEARDEAAYAALLDEAHALASQVSLAKGLFMGGLFFAGSVTMTAVLYFGGSLAGKGEMTGGELTSFSMYTGLVALGFTGLSSCVSDTWKSAVAARRVFDLLDRQPSSSSSAAAAAAEHETALASSLPTPSAPTTGHVRFEGLHFAYPNRPSVSVLQGVDLEIKPGQVVAIVGSSGAGKSTLLALLLRLYAPTQGAIWMDGERVDAVDAQWVRQQVGLVEQEPALFTGTIADNIRYGRPEATEAEVQQAAKEANAHEFIAAFPEQYETYVGERGKAQLSGGERQRITLARALVKQPPILVLDEATSALDHENERLVQAALDKAMKGRTTIVVAHRLSTVEKADVIFVLEGGKVAEKGTFKELMGRKDGAFVRLHQSASFQSM